MSKPEFPLEELSSSITDNARIVSQYLASQNLPQPSSRSDGPSTVLPKGSPQSIQEARENLIANSLEILHLAIGPSEFLPHLATGVRLPPSALTKEFRG
jgi:6-hydroxytryprostatin B O-methyltransferase